MSSAQGVVGAGRIESSGASGAPVATGGSGIVAGRPNGSLAISGPLSAACDSIRLGRRRAPPRLPRKRGIRVALPCQFCLRQGGAQGLRLSMVSPALHLRGCRDTRGVQDPGELASPAIDPPLTDCCRDSSY